MVETYDAADHPLQPQLYHGYFPLYLNSLSCKPPKHCVLQQVLGTTLAPT